MSRNTTAWPKRDLAEWVRKLLLHPAVPSGTEEWHIVAEMLGWDDALRAKRAGRARKNRRESRTKTEMAEVAEARALWFDPTFTGEQVADRTGYAKSNLYLWFGPRGRTRQGDR